jgi:hypothetical protein
VSAATDDVFTRIARELEAIVDPVRRAATNELARTRLLAALGWNLQQLSGYPIGRLMAAAGTIAGTASDIGESVATPPKSFEDLQKLIDDIGALFTSIRDLSQLAQDPAITLPPDAGAALEQLGEELADLLVTQYLLSYHPRVFHTARLLTLARSASDNATNRTAAISGSGETNVREPTAVPEIRLDHLSPLLSNPLEALKQEYLGAGGLDTPDSARALAALLYDRLAPLAAVTGAAVTLGDDEAFPATNDPLRTLGLRWPIAVATGKAEIGLMIELFAATEGAPRVAVTPVGWLDETWYAKGWAVELSGAGGAETFSVSSAGPTLSAEVASLTLKLSIAQQGPEGEPIAVIGSAAATHVELGRVTITFQLDLAAAKQDIEIGISSGKSALVIAAGDGDGFLATVLPEDPILVQFNLGLVWSQADGLRFSGGHRLEIDEPVNESFLGVGIDRISIRVAPKSDGLRVAVGAAGGLTLGPFTAVVENMGIVAQLSFPRSGGNLGPADLKQLAFKPPKGVGLAIDAPAVSGGGFLEFDDEAGRYVGVADLIIVDVASVKAVGIITTRLPDGSPGFALLLLITAEGFTPIPLGFGFQLTGIGGLVALNRTVDADTVRGGLRDGVLDSILFIEDPVTNAARVVSTLDRVFPLAPDRLLIGPLAEISWGSPPIVKIRLALLLEIPQPVRAALLAALSALLPDEDDPVVELHVDAIGVLDLGRGELALDASLHDSRLLQFTLTGDMALRLNWGDAPTFLLSVGGFHPKFKAPAGLRPLNRVALTLTGSDNPRVRFETYIALTSNTIQMGARVTVYAEAAGFGVDGGGAFDALIQWSPFAVDVSFQAWVRIFGPTGTLLAAQLAVEVAGPQPWHVTGVAEIHVLFLSAKVPIDLTIGTAAVPPPVETVDVAALVWEQVSRRANWQAALPADAVPGVTLAAASTDRSDGQASTLPIHPFALLSLRQRVVPLGTTISRVGARLPKDGTRSYDLAVTAPTGVQVETLTDLFAPAQYRDLPDDAKLSGPSFSALPAGLSLRPEAAKARAQAGVIATDLAFETLDVTDLSAPATEGNSVPAGAASALAASPSVLTDARVRAGWEVPAA